MAIPGKERCGTCAFWHSQTKQCRILRAEMEEDAKCQRYSDQPLVCELCGTPLTQPLIMTDSTSVHVICLACWNVLESCKHCVHSGCAFKEDKSAPQMVMRTIRQGNMVAQTQVPNPDLIERHCKTCQCYAGEQDWCNKQNEFCKHYDYKDPFLK